MYLPNIKIEDKVRGCIDIFHGGISIIVHTCMSYAY